MSSPQPQPISFMVGPYMTPQQMEMPDPLVHTLTCSRCYALVHEQFQFQHQSWHDTEDAWAEPQPEET